MNGIINLYKERGYTSHDAVAKLRGILHQKKIGHTGTLDPEAEGVLPVCLGNATRLCGLLTDKDKTYEAVLRLGIVTDTQDMTGVVQRESGVCVTKERAEEEIHSFVGEQEQIPPMYSAVKINGKRLYELAREGRIVEREARRIRIHDIGVKKWDLAHDRITLVVSCSKGTYIRTLCQDIGDRLGCGGCMESLLRTRAGQFVLSDSLRLSEAEKLFREGSLDEHIMPVEKMFSEHPKITVKEAGQKYLKNGNPLSEEQLEETAGAGKNGRVRVYGCDGAFLALYEWQEERGLYLPVKMFL